MMLYRVLACIIHSNLSCYDPERSVKEKHISCVDYEPVDVEFRSGDTKLSRATDYPHPHVQACTMPPTLNSVNRDTLRGHLYIP